MKFCNNYRDSSMIIFAILDIFMLDFCILVVAAMRCYRHLVSNTILFLYPFKNYFLEWNLDSFFFNFCKCLFCCSPFTIIILSYCRLIISNNGLQADQCISTFFFNCPDDYLITQLFSQWSELNCQKCGNIGTYNSQCQVSSDAFILFIVVCRFITLI